MNTLPASYLEVRAAFILRKKSFRDVAKQLNTSPQFVRNTLLTYWGRTDLQPGTDATLTKSILAAVEAMLLSPGTEPEQPADTEHPCAYGT
jgi:hypothetical protein